MGRTIFNIVMIIVGLFFAVLAVFATPQHPHLVAQVRTAFHFFDLLLRILGVTALLNYIWKCCCCPMKEQSNP